MLRIHVCPLSKLAETVRATGAQNLITLIDKGTPVRRPSGIDAEKHLVVVLSDIVVEIEGHTLPAKFHVEKLIAFVRRWDQTRPLLIHCWAGVSRSPAAAFIAACALRPHRNEAEIAQAVRPIPRQRRPIRGSLPSPTRCLGATDEWLPPSRKSAGGPIVSKAPLSVWSCVESQPRLQHFVRSREPVRVNAQE